MICYGFSTAFDYHRFHASRPLLIIHVTHGIIWAAGEQSDGRRRFIGSLVDSQPIESDTHQRTLWGSH